MTEATTPAKPIDSPIYVLGVKAENFMLIEAFDATVSESGLTMFCGNNANGKTGAMTAIEATILGGDAVPEMPVRAGAERAETTTYLGRDGKPLYTARRVYRDGGGTSLEVRAADGSKLASPQSILNALTDAKTFNPVDFADPPGARTVAAANDRRLEMLFGICPLSIDLRSHDAARSTLQTELSAAAKRAKDLEAVVRDAAATAAPDGAEEDESALVAEIARAENSGSLVAAAAKRVKELEAEVADLEAQAAKIQERLRLLAAEWDKQAKVAGGKPADIEPAKARLAEIRDRNTRRRAAVADRTRAEERAKSLLAARDDVAELTKRAKEMDRIRDESIAAAKFPVKALTIDSSGRLALTTPNGVIPFSQASTAQRIKVGFAVMASRNPKLRTCLIPSGNDLDHESIATIARIAAHYGFQVFVERIVPDSGGACIVFQAGKATATIPAGGAA